MKFVFAFILSLCSASAATGMEPVALKSVFVKLEWGTAEIRDAAGKKREIKRISESEKDEIIRLEKGETLTTASDSACNVICPGAGSLRIEGEGGIKLPAAEQETDTKTTPSLEMLGGKLFLQIDGEQLSKQKKEFRVKTPTTILAVKGTSFFVETGPEHETTGVHEGTVEMWETQSGKNVEIRGGKVALAKPGAIAPPRQMTAEEKALSDRYNLFAYEFVPLEGRKRIFQTENGEWPTGKDAGKFLTSERGEESGDSYAIKMTYRPSLQVSKKIESSKINIFSERKLSPHKHGEPKLIEFSVRSNKPLEQLTTNLWGLTYEDRSYQCYLINHPVPLANEWVTFCIALQELDKKVENPDEALTRLWIGFDSEQVKGDEDLVIEISPVMIGVLPKE